MTLGTLCFALGAVLVLAGIIGGGFEMKELRIPRISTVSRVLAMASGVAFIIVALRLPQSGGGERGKPTMSSMEVDVDRPGADYNNYELPGNDPKACEDACLNDRQCRAWTYVRPGFQGANAHCWLKSAQPPARPQSCCVSGTKQRK